jgi:hypothetical protein
MPSRPNKAEHVTSTTGSEQMSKVGQDPANYHKAEQLSMFMTPNEIHKRWQPLDADRHDTDYGYDGGTEWGTRQPKSWDTGNTMPTDINEAGTATHDRVQRRAPGVHEGSAAAAGSGYGDTGTIMRSRGGGKTRLRQRGSGEPEMESDDELWDRKLNETHQFGPGGQHEEYGGTDSDPLKAAHNTGTLGSYKGSPTGASRFYAGEGPRPSSGAWERHYEREESHENRRQEQRETNHAAGSMYDSIAEKGVLGPIRLGRQTGSQGKMEVVGGHHRLAAATDIDPNKLVPVLHDETIWDAQRPPKGGYPYA